MDRTPERAAQRLRTALDLFEAGVALMRQSFRRRYPEESEPEIRARVGRWLQTRPGAEHGDGPGRPVPWPRPAK